MTTILNEDVNTTDTLDVEQLTQESTESIEEEKIEQFKSLLQEFSVALSEYEAETGNRVAMNVALYTAESQANESYYPFSYFCGDQKTLSNVADTTDIDVISTEDVEELYDPCFLETLDFSINLHPIVNVSVLADLAHKSQQEALDTNKVTLTSEGEQGEEIEVEVVLIDGQAYSV